MAHPDLDALLDPLVRFAQQQLEKHGEFFPIGASVGGDGEVTLSAIELDDERPPSQAVIDGLVSSFRSNR